MTTNNPVKPCSHCKMILPLSHFNKNKSKPDGLGTSCRDCHKKFSRANYERNKAITMQRNKLQHERQRLAILELKKGPCHDCGETFPPYIMEFDHRDPSTKKFNMSAYGTRSAKTVRAEIEKCDLVCANCHKLRTFERCQIGAEKKERDMSLIAHLPPLDFSAHLRSNTLPSEGSTLSTELREQIPCESQGENGL